MDEHPGNDRLRDGLKHIIDDVDMIKKAVHTVTEPMGVTGLAREADVRDDMLATQTRAGC